MFTRYTRTYWKRPVHSEELLKQGFTHIGLYFDADKGSYTLTSVAAKGRHETIAVGIESFEVAVALADEYEEHMDSPSTSYIIVKALGLIFFCVLVLAGVRACA